ncbi:MAG: TAT-variant-translocated molybdopterin oxidoreductase, partial [Acidobacteriota bacterium]|nr:TAT-variant-translocated molybdopterin oxidoreductase [Acidobacteriota bacterium]
MSDSPQKLDLAAVRARLEGARGPEYWRSLDELSATPEFQEMVEREFPRQAIGWSDDENPGEGRRNFLKLMGASLALGGLAACTRQPNEFIMPYVRQPEELIPGRPLFFATATTLNGVATGVLAESHEGRPTKIEGNPEHPASQGALDVFSQASVLGLYDPDRSQALTLNGAIRSWPYFVTTFRNLLADQKAKGGAGIRILTETNTSPSVAAQWKAIQAIYPQAKWHQWDPAGPHSARAASMLAFGQPLNTYYDFSNANVIVSLDADFLNSGPASLRYTRQFTERRKVGEGSQKMNRLYVAEPFPTPTGVKADHRLMLRAGDIQKLAWALAISLGVAQGAKQTDDGNINNWTGPVSRDLEQNKGACIVIAGEQQPPIVHALAAILNEKLGNVGKTVFYTDPIEANPVDQVASLNDLVKDLDSGAVDLLLILDGNPAFTAPVELGMRDRLKKAKLRVRLGL